jgi:predicted enzyme related to lactoylglutathione lyase
MLTHLSRIVLLVRGPDGVANAVGFYHHALQLPLRRMTDHWAELDLIPTIPVSFSNVPDNVNLSTSSSSTTNITTTTTTTTISVILHIQAVMDSSEAMMSTGYTPLLNLQVHDLDSVVAAAVQAGAHLDGPIQYPAHGKIASLRTPDGHMVGLHEPYQ